MPKDCEVKAREVDRELSGVEYVRKEPPGPALALLRSIPPTIGLVVGALSRSVKQFVPDCTEKVSPERVGRCHGGGPGPRYDRKLNQPRIWPGLLARRGLGPTRGSHSCHGLEAVRFRPLKLDGRARWGARALGT